MIRFLKCWTDINGACGSKLVTIFRCRWPLWWPMAKLICHPCLKLVTKIFRRQQKSSRLKPSDISCFLIWAKTAVQSSRTLFFGIQETLFLTRCYAKKKKWEFERKEYRITNLHLQPETNLQKHKNQHLHRNAICINLTCTSVYFGEGLSLTVLVEFVNKTLGLKLGPNYWVSGRKTLIQETT